MSQNIRTNHNCLVAVARRLPPSTLLKVIILSRMSVIKKGSQTILHYQSLPLQWISFELPLNSVDAFWVDEMTKLVTAMLLMLRGSIVWSTFIYNASPLSQPVTLKSRHSSPSGNTDNGSRLKWAKKKGKRVAEKMQIPVGSKRVNWTKRSKSLKTVSSRSWSRSQRRRDE